MKISAYLLCVAALGCASNSSAKKPTAEHNAAWERNDDVTRPSDPALDPTAHEPAGQPPGAPATPAGEPAPTSERTHAPRHDRPVARETRTPHVAPYSAAVHAETVARNTAATTRDTTRDKVRDTHIESESGALTPLDQGNGEEDLRITQEIRRAVIGDDALSFTAKNVKIITVNGKVTLRGPVDSESERKSLEAAARGVAGAKHVDSQLEVKGR